MLRLASGATILVDLFFAKFLEHTLGGFEWLSVIRWDSSIPDCIISRFVLNVLQKICLIYLEVSAACSPRKTCYKFLGAAARVYLPVSRYLS